MRAPAAWQQRLDRLARALRLSRPVTLLESCLAEVPVVIGYLRPVILVPVGLLAGMPAGQVEAILLHELAHIRRHDYLVNLLQTVVEGLLFYHPAVWWISGVIRAERENCCDDLVVATQGDAHEYAAALDRSGTKPLGGTPKPRWPPHGGNLVKRIRRLLDQPETPRAALTPVLSAAILTITVCAGSHGGVAIPTPTVPQPAQVKQLTPMSNGFALSEVAQRGRRIHHHRAERAAFKNLQTDEEREHFIEQFWLRRDPTPGTPENEFKEEHYRRIAYANEHFAPAHPRLEDRPRPDLHHLRSARREGVASRR